MAAPKSKGLGKGQDDGRPSVLPAVPQEPRPKPVLRPSLSVTSDDDPSSRGSIAGEPWRSPPWLPDKCTVEQWQALQDRFELPHMADRLGAALALKQLQPSWLFCFSKETGRIYLYDMEKDQATVEPGCVLQ